MVQLCPRCEERLVEKKGACGPCGRAGDSLMKYWHAIDMPLRAAGKGTRSLPTLWVEAEAA